MSTVANATASQAASSAASLAGLSGASEADQAEDKFLTLLVTQLRNQDPLNPMDNAQMTSQMAQIRTVSGLEKLNTTLSAMAASFTAGQALQATSMIGRDVLVEGNQVQLAAGSADGALELDGAAGSVLVAIHDAAGRLVHQVDLGPQPAGVVRFRWDGATDQGGAAADGRYSFTVKATQGSAEVGATTLAQSRVSGVIQGKDGVELSLVPSGRAALAAVRQVM